jgi:mannose/fructose/N-acetylgalactosamine-specific phosphotransferase system component IIC
MAQVLLTLTLLSIAGLIATIVAGYRATPVHASTHILIALATVIAGLFAQSMTMFFFIGMGKEIKEASGQNAEVVRRTRVHKAKVFPAATYAIAALMVTFIMGGGVKTGKTPLWLHTGLAGASLVLLARAYYVELKAMEDNARLMEEYLKE